jgi:fructan beta-fructosidase
MCEKTFRNDKRFLHIPICDEHPRNYQYIKIYDGARIAGEFHIGIAYGDKPTDFFVALNLGNYGSPSVTLVCESDIAGIFDGIVGGGNPEEEKELYPNLYSEPTRQQIHFSPKRGWLNDPNGLFIKDGKFHLYFQHNPFGSRHGGVNVSWGHATSDDGVHFTEYPDAIMPHSSRCLVASGSAIVDKNNSFGKGEGAVIAAYTALQARQYGRTPVTQNEGQMLLYSIDDGKTFTPLETTFSRADLQRLSEEKNEMQSEIDEEIASINAQLDEEERIWEEEHSSKKKKKKVNNPKKNKKKDDTQEIATLPITDEEYNGD